MLIPSVNNNITVRQFFKFKNEVTETDLPL